MKVFCSILVLAFCQFTYAADVYFTTVSKVQLFQGSILPKETNSIVVPAGSILTLLTTEKYRTDESIGFDGVIHLQRFGNNELAGPVILTKSENAIDGDNDTAPLRVIGPAKVIHDTSSPSGRTGLGLSVAGWKMSPGATDPGKTLLISPNDGNVRVQWQRSTNLLDWDTIAAKSTNSSFSPIFYRMIIER